MDEFFDGLEAFCEIVYLTARWEVYRRDFGGTPVDDYLFADPQKARYWEENRGEALRHWYP